MKVGNRNVEAHGIYSFCVNNEAHVTSPAMPLFAGSINVPASAHQHVSQQNQIAREIHKNPFAAGFHFFYSAARDTGIDFNAVQFWQNACKACDRLTCQSAMQGAGCAEDCVALWHYALSEMS
jgi:hypothetical protein